MITDFGTKVPVNEEWHIVLQQLTIETNKYENLTKNDTSERERLSLEILSLLRRASEVHPDGEVRNKFRRDADAWERGDRKTKKRMLRPLKLFLQGMGFLAAAPVLALGAIFHGTGHFFVFLGDVLTFGQLNKFVKGTILE
ncbi:hypothetical protein QCA50_019759 [Cerrena zonata]|uniref:Uncharacterized protein n=1 Tax=Cerrena zonata TaxID=2478898 RepID=A0AAW0F8Y3_9APHY